MWYVAINGKVIPIPYQRYEDAWAACAHYKETMVAVCTEIVPEDRLDEYR